MSRAAVRQVVLVPRQDTGFLDAHYPDGIVAGSTISLSPIPDIVTITAGQTYTEDFAGYISGSGYTVNFVPISGTLAAVGLTAAGHTFTPQLTQNFLPAFERPAPGVQTVLSGVTIAGSVFLQMQVSKGTELHLSNIFQRTVVQPTDTAGPTVGEGLTVTVLGSTATLSGDYPSDPTAPGILASGLARVIVQSSTDQTTWSTAGTIVPPNPGASPPLSSFTIGSPAGSNSASQTGHEVDFTVNGGLFGASSDAVLTYGAQMQGDYELIATVGTFSSTATFAESGLMVRGDTSAGSAYARVSRRPSGSSGLTFAWRVPGGSMQFATIADPNASSDLLMRIEKQGDTYTGSYWAGSWVTIGSASVSMSQSTYALGYASTATTGTTVNTAIKEFSINILGQWTLQVPLSPGVIEFFRFYGQDGTGNTGGISSTVSATPASSGLKKHTPGNWIILDPNTTFAAQLTRIAVLGAIPNSNIVGIEVWKNWATMENPQLVGGRAQYDGSWDSTGKSGLTGLLQLINACTTAGFKFAFHNYTFYGGSSNSLPAKHVDSFTPAYLAGAAYGPTNAAQGLFGDQWVNCYASGINIGVVPILWNQAVMDRLVAMAVWYMSPSGGNLDANPTVEIMSWIDETAPHPVAGYSDAAMMSTFIGPNGYVARVSAASPDTDLQLWLNFIQNSQNYPAILADAFANKASIGGPDTCNETGTHPRVITADQAFRGINPDTGVANWIDYRGRMRWIATVEWEDLGVSGTFTLPATIGSGQLSDIVAHADLQVATRIRWVDNNFSGPNSNRTQTTPPNVTPNLLTYIAVTNLANTQPATYQ